MAEFVLRIDGMHCGACVRRVSQALATAGLNVKEVRMGAARFESAQDPPPVDRAITVIQKAGYRAHLDSNSESNPAHLE
jgi:copper chaperone